MPKLKLKSEQKFDAHIGEDHLLCSCSDSPPPPDYGPMAQASKESAEIMAALGREQLAESRRQYDENAPLAREVAQAQMGLMNETRRQGTDYYDYMVSRQRPIEDLLNAEAMQAGSEADQEAYAARGIADARRGSTSTANMIARQGLRYGFSPESMAKVAGGLAQTSAGQQAAAANAGREQAKNLGWAKKMDVSGLYRGLPGASSGAYANAINAGNSATGNQMAPGQALLGGMAQGAGMVQGGLNTQMQGLGGILNAQTGVYNAGSGDSGLGGALGMLGAAAINKMPWSDRRLKEAIERVGVDETTGLNLYEFHYKDDPEDRRYRGVMADEVESIMPDAVVYDELGFAAVNYDMLGIEMVEV